MTIKQLIAQLQALVDDPKSGATMDTPVEHEHPDGGMSEDAASVYVHSYGDDPFRKGRVVAMISGLTPDEIARLEATK